MLLRLPVLQSDRYSEQPSGQRLEVIVPRTQRASLHSRLLLPPLTAQPLRATAACDTGKETTERRPTAATEEYEVNEGAWDQHSELHGQRTSFRQAKKQAYSGDNE